MTSIRLLAEILHEVVLEGLKEEVLDALDYESIAISVLDRVSDIGYLSEKAKNRSRNGR